MPIIRIVDFETTGTEPPEAKVCQVGLCDLDVDRLEVSDEYAQWFCRVDVMPPEARAIHHISLQECRDTKRFDPGEMVAFCNVEAIAAHNAAFELQFFDSPVPVICTYKAALRIWPEAPSHSNGALRYWLEDQELIEPVHELTQPAHHAGPDAYVTAHILLAMLKAGYTGRQMVEWTREPAALPTCPIGKFRGQPWADVEGGFLSWMTRQESMEPDLKWNAQRELDRRLEAPA